MKEIVFFLLLVIGIPGCSFSQKKGTDLELSSKNFKKLVDNSISFTIPLLSVEELHDNKDDYIILDAREKEEYEVSRIPGATYVGYDEPLLKYISTLDKESNIVFYCSIGYRSEKIGEMAKELGLKNVHNLYGSIFEWVNKGYELEDHEGKPTTEVHGYNWVWGKWIKNKDYKKVYK